jgi:hypothetical protein
MLLIVVQVEESRLRGMRKRNAAEPCEAKFWELFFLSSSKEKEAGNDNFTPAVRLLHLPYWRYRQG